MPKLTTAATVTNTVKLDPKLRKKLTTKMQEFFVKRQAIKKLEGEAEKIKADIESLRDEAGEESIALDGIGTVTLVAPVRKKFNPKKFVSNGGDLDIYNQSFDDVLSRPYTKVSPPGKNEEEE